VEIFQEQKEPIMPTDAQRRAQNKYRKKIKQIITKFYPNEQDQQMYEWIKSQDNATSYIKDLVLQDMKNKGQL
jgi:muramidase (phage lysozyme)